MIFPVLELEKTVQVDDKTRLDAVKSYITPDEAAITLIEIEPEASNGFIDVTSIKYLDWQYSTDGDKVVTVRVTTDGAPVTTSKTIPVVTAVDDYLYSGDEDLTAYESNIMDFVRPGRNSYLDIHRASQDRILRWLDEHRIWDVSGNRLAKEAIVDIEEVEAWSKFMTLKYIFESISNAVDDVFHDKAMRYKQLEEAARNKSALRLDRDGDGNSDDEAKLDLRSFRILRG